MENVVQIKAITDVGLIRQNNEDNFIVGENISTFPWTLSSSEIVVPAVGTAIVIADGMGGEKAGEVASDIAIKAIEEFISANIIPVSNEVELVKLLNDALLNANKKICDFVLADMDFFGMGTTATICLIRDEKLYVSLIGDSR